MSAGYLRPLWLPHDEELAIGPDGRPLAPAAPTLPPVDGPPEPPAYEAPEIATAPPPGFRERLAAALAAAPAYRPGRGTSGGQALLGGLLSGTARGFAASGAATAKAAQVERDRANTVRKAEADRNWSNAQATWREKLRRYYRAKDAPDGSGRMVLTAQMVADARLPKESIGTPMNPKEYAERRERVMGVLPSGAPVPPKASPKPRPAPKPKETPPTERRRTMVAGIVADLTTRGMGDSAGLRAYYNQPGVAAKLAEHGLTLADLLRAVPE